MLATRAERPATGDTSGYQTSRHSADPDLLEQRTRIKAVDNPDHRASRGYRDGMPTRSFQPTVLAGALLLGLVALGGCAATPDETTPTSSPVFASEDDAFAAAEVTYLEYMETFNSIDFTDEDTFAPHLDLTVGELRDEERKSLSEMHANGTQVTGAASVKWFRGLDVYADGLISARVCTDVSQTELVDSSGRSLTSASRPTLVATEVSFVTSNGVLLLSDERPVEDESCIS
ncbi:hypothetical protein GCM10025768_19540 [Microbacterium pseudoresistens]|uniref:Uncharacterized protein n=1 Tax=Microbacterium pseudoresistens TaxID=640634 RepID=A0A7Y9EX89_9MICO|nr:hypothetical protein [Microbacterium pseudoresistens]NYD55648.1 hypothetical protein [Microbacterium pseudoresistens]